MVTSNPINENDLDALSGEELGKAKQKKLKPRRERRLVEVRGKKLD